MPSSHRRYAGWTIERIREDARRIGPATAALCEQILESQAPSRAGLPRLSRHRPPRRLLRRGARRSRRRARHRDRRQDLRLRQIHPRQQARSEAGAQGAPRRRLRSSIPTSAGRATTIRRTQLAQTSHPRSASRPRPPGNGQGLRRSRRPPIRQRTCRMPTGSPCSSTGRRHGGGTNA